jgi:endonuclease/exonuclease/phosphatase family metal-dependent hydrolase
MVEQVCILSFNMHKGYDLFNQSSLRLIKDAILKSKADIVLLQEISGQMSDRQVRDHQSSVTDQLEYLADSIWPFGQYGKNAVFPNRHHGNAILSRFPIEQWANFDISETIFEGRGLLMTCVEILPGHQFWICNTHLSLFHRDRLKQFHRIAWHLKPLLNSGSSVILGGDFNDWNLALSPMFKQYLDMNEAFCSTQGREAQTFPAILPWLRLDRLYYFGCECTDAHVLTSPWNKLSDHLPLFAQFTPKILLSSDLF